MASVWAIIEKNQRVLLVQRSLKTSRPAQWCFPGGGIHAGESPQAACIREVTEEVGLQVTVTKSLAAFSDQEYFHCVAAADSIRLKANECQAFVWADPTTLLGVGEIMNLRRVLHVLQLLGYHPQRPAKFNDSGFGAHSK